MNWIRTVQGRVATETLGLILPHEHLFTDLRGLTVPDYAQADPDHVVSVMSPLLAEAHAAGVTMLVECTPPGVGRNIHMLKRLAQVTPVHIVAATGVYREAFHPSAFKSMSLEELAGLWTRELTEGIEGTSAQAGFIKLAVSDEGITELEARNLKAAALASQRTGAVIASHTQGGQNAHQEMNILEAAGLDLARFIWVHTQSEPDPAAHLATVRRGAYVEFDNLAWNEQSDQIVDYVLALLGAGYGERILLSHDAGWYSPGLPGGQPQGGLRGYTVLTSEFIPALRARGVGDDAIHLLTVTNPARAFAFS